MSLVNSIAGKLISKTPTLANIEIGGFVFNVKISLASFEKLPKINENITLLTHLHVKEDILELYGFVYETERSLFLNLNKINGIGPRSAMNILSGTSPAEFKQKIIDGDVKSLTSIPGIGAKTAKRIIIELKEVFTHDLDASEEIGFDDKKETSFLVALFLASYNIFVGIMFGQMIHSINENFELYHLLFITGCVCALVLNGYYDVWVNTNRKELGKITNDKDGKYLGEYINLDTLGDYYEMMLRFGIITPNYMFEIIEWLSFFLLTLHTEALMYLIATALLLVIRTGQLSVWYQYLK